MSEPGVRCKAELGVTDGPKRKERTMHTHDKKIDASIDEAWNRFEAELKRGKNPHKLEVQCLHTDDTKTLMSKGHQDPTEFVAACEEWNGGPLQGWGKVRHGWGRTVPDRTGEYKFLMLPAEPHSRGAYPITTVVDDPAYDHE